MYQCKSKSILWRSNCFACTSPSCTNAPWMSRGFYLTSTPTTETHYEELESWERLHLIHKTNIARLTFTCTTPLIGIWLFNMQQITRPKQAHYSWQTSVFSVNFAETFEHLQRSLPWAKRLLLVSLVTQQSFPLIVRILTWPWHFTHRSDGLIRRTTVFCCDPNSS